MVVKKTRCNKEIRKEKNQLDAIASRIGEKKFGSNWEQIIMFNSLVKTVKYKNRRKE